VQHCKEIGLLGQEAEFLIQALLVSKIVGFSEQISKALLSGTSSSAGELVAISS